MVLVLVVGDLLIPQRAMDIPAAFKKLLVPGKIQQIICTGNLGQREIYDYFKSISLDFTCVKGDMDLSENLPERVICQIGNFKVGLLHGHQIVPSGDSEALSFMARQLQVDVLVYGNTHQFEAFEKEGRFFLNPGSLTGAFSGYTQTVVPSFVLLDVHGSSMTVYVYQLIQGEMKVEKLDFQK